MNQGLGLIGEEAVQEQLLLALYTFVEGKFGGRLHSVDRGRRSLDVALFLTSGIASGGENRGVL